MNLLLCKASIASDAVAKWENWWISGNFLKYDYLIPLKAQDLSINVFLALEMNISWYVLCDINKM